MSDANRVEFAAAFPPNCQPLRGGGKDSWRVWLDAYLSPADVAKLVLLAQAERSLRVSIELDE